jgi:hypothetical protein
MNFTAAMQDIFCECEIYSNIIQQGCERAMCEHEKALHVFLLFFSLFLNEISNNEVEFKFLNAAFN